MEHCLLLDMSNQALCTQVGGQDTKLAKLQACVNGLNLSPEEEDKLIADIKRRQGRSAGGPEV